ncbi:MAG TPA: hypothetical protein VF299_09405 [Mycobacterium sp.]
MARNRALRLGGVVTTFITFSLSPLHPMPVARADGEDDIIDQIISSLSAVDPTAGMGLDSWLANLDAASQGALNFDPSSWAALPDAALPTESTDLAQLYEQFIYDPQYAFEQAWINGDTFLGDLTVQWDNALNGFWGDLGGQGILIGNGADGTALDPNGGAGGLIFGDGGAGWNSTVAGEAGGEGGAAFNGNGGAGGNGFDGSDGGAGGDTAYGIAGAGGNGGTDGGTGGAGGNATGVIFGNGGAGGAGGPGSPGGAGGAGGNGAFLFGDGGNGGAGGAGGGGGIGGAGGQGGIFGEHGAQGPHGASG